MMKKTIVAVALMVSGAAFAGEQAPCGKVCRMKNAVKHYGYVKPREAVKTTIDYTWNGNYSDDSKVAVWGDRAVRIGGIYFVSTQVVAPTFAKIYAYVSAQINKVRSK